LRHLALVEMRPAAETGQVSSVLPAALRGIAVLRVLQGPQAPRLETARPPAGRPS
jgi:hypothetical protein